MFTIEMLTSETNNSYTILDVFYPPNLGPAIHMHPKGTETFYIIDGSYEFILYDNSIIGKPGDTIFAPKETLHKFVVGHKGGHPLVISPIHLEFYFFKVNYPKKEKPPIQQNTQ